MIVSVAGTESLGLDIGSEHFGVVSGICQCQETECDSSFRDSVHVSPKAMTSSNISRQPSSRRNDSTAGDSVGDVQICSNNNILTRCWRRIFKAK